MSFNFKKNKTINNRAKKYILFENRMTVNILIVNYLRPERVWYPNNCPPEMKKNRNNKCKENNKEKTKPIFMKHYFLLVEVAVWVFHSAKLVNNV